MIRRSAAGAAVGTALVLSVTGCLGDGGGKASGTGANQGAVRLTAADMVNKVSQKTGEIRSFQATLTSTTSMSGQQVRMNGRITYRAKPTVALKMSIPAMTVNGRSQSGFQEILLGDTLYMKMPALTARTGGKPWARMSLKKLGAKSGIDFSSLMKQSEQADPSANVKMLTASKDVRKVGQETVGGVATTHYQGSYSVQDALAKLGADQRAKMQQMMGEMGIDRMDFDLWVDGQDLPRKIAVRSPAGAKMATNTTITYSGFNGPVSIAAPPASQVADAN